MTSTHSLMSIVLATALLSGAAVARSDAPPTQEGAAATATAERQARGAQAGMRKVANRSRLNQPGNDWRYFSDPHTQHAVVISPRGEYFLSLGDGLRRVTGPAGQALPRPAAS